MHVAKMVQRFSAPNLPDKFGLFCFDGGSTQDLTFRPGPYLKGIRTDEVIKAGEETLVLYQVLPGTLGTVWITIFRQTPKLPVYPVASLPTGLQAGARAYVTDATATTFSSVVAGGGANRVPVTFDGTSWRIG